MGLMQHLTPPYTTLDNPPNGWHIQDMTEALISLLGLAFLTWFIAGNLKAREAGIEAARALCKQEGLLFLDDSVVQQKLRLRRNDQGKVQIQRSFGFEYSDTGNNRRPGYVTLMGFEVTLTYIGPRLVADLSYEQTDQIG